MGTQIIEADLDNASHGSAITELLNRYALDLQGFGRPLPKSVLSEVIPGMRRLPTTIVFLAQSEEEYVGMAICFLSFSTFHARPLINIHDFTVLAEYRGRGIGTALVDAVESKARELDCCKLTLEVQEMNRRAIRLYESRGFSKAILDESEGRALFYSKYLSGREA